MAQPGAGIQTFLNDWIPQKFNAMIPDKLDQFEATNQMIDAAVRTALDKRLRPLMVRDATVDTQVLNKIDDKVTATEGKIGAFDRNILNKIDLNLLSPENSPAIRSIACVPVSPGEVVPPGQTACPPASGMSGQMGGTNIDCIDGKAVITLTHEGVIQQVPTDAPCPYDPGTGLGGPPVAGLMNCPVPPPCPSQKSCDAMDVYTRVCKDLQDKCMYAVPLGHGPLNPQDHSVATDVSCDETLLNIFSQEKYFCPDIPLCNIVPIEGPGQCCPPLICPKPPGMIINVQPPPGGQIQNQQPPQGQIENPQYPPIEFPPYTQTIPPSSMVNIALLNPPQQGQQDCNPSGDYALALQICDDGTKTEQLSNEMIGQSIVGLLENKTPVEWWKDKYEDLKEDYFAMFFIPTEG
jgi:hypothetical protein